MLIRKAEISDAGQISAVISRLSVKYIACEFSAEGRQRLLDSISPVRIRKHIESEYDYFVAENDGEVIGVVALKDDCHLYHLFVAESHQRCGIATKLWELVFELSLKRGNKDGISVNSSRYAQRFYEHLGFVALSGPGTRKGVISIPMRFEPPPIDAL